MNHPAIAVALFGATLGPALAAPIVFSAVTTGGSADPSFNAVVSAFRGELGALNPPGACAPGPCTAGRREVNWDAVPVAFSSPNPFPGAFFNGQSGVQPAARLRGLALTTPGTGFRVSATEFSDEAPAFGPAEFDPFSPARLFASMGSNVTDASFSVPGTPAAAATVSGFGVVFSDVDYTGSASLSFYDAAGRLVFAADAPGVFATANGSNAQGSFSFLGVAFDGGERIARVRIVSGSHGIDGNYVGLDDAVVMDDFIFAEPQAAVPEPQTVALFLAGLLLLRRARRR